MNKKLALALLAIAVIVLAVAVGLDIRSRQGTNGLRAPHCNAGRLCY